ncbi:MAG: DUF2207 domain-containing protein [Hyphomicrobiales bacterium]
MVPLLRIVSPQSRTLIAGLLSAFLLLFAANLPAVADERITQFSSEVTVNPDSSLTVREIIDVNAEGDVIKRGIFRDIPTTYDNGHGTRFRVRLDVESVTRDGTDEPYTVLDISNGKRIRIGNPDVLVSLGPHRYVITYKTTRQIAFLDNYDELYWNVTGNDWVFPIDKAIAKVNLPSGTRILQSAAYTGPQGAQGKDFRVIAEGPGLYEAETTRTLSPGEGFTIAVGFPKGILTPPSTSEETGAFISDNAGIVAVILGVLAVLGYYLYAWNKVGRDPPKGVIIPLFSPPTGLGPAGARYVTKQGFDDRGFASALVGLAVKGWLKIWDDDGFSITKLTDKGQPMTQTEAALYRAIPSGTTDLKKENHVKVRAMRQALEDALKKENEGAAFVRNAKWFWIGIAASAGALLLSALFLPAEAAGTGLFLALWGGIWWSVLIVIGWNVIKGIVNSSGFLGKIGSLFGAVFLIPFVFGGVAAPVAVMASGQSPGLYILGIAAIILVILNALFQYLLRAPTVAGRKLLDQIEGFRMYLSTAEEERLKVLHPPDKTPELFEKFLPYALALDCENEWNAKFATVLAAAAAAGAAAPAWYSGNHWDASRPGSFTSSLGSSLASSTAAASVAPGSSSYSGGGSSGGGSSGGGGGGGGGGGW